MGNEMRCPSGLVVSIFANMFAAELLSPLGTDAAVQHDEK